MRIEIDHVDIVTTHACNNHCKHCIDKFVNQSSDVIEMATVDKFLRKIREYVGQTKELEVLLLGGEPTMLSTDKLLQIAEIIHSYGFKAMMSTNGNQREKIIDIMPYYDSIQITVGYNSKVIDIWRPYRDKVNMKLAADKSTTMEKLKVFIDNTKDFYRQSVCMYFTPDFKELCEDRDIWDMLSTLSWERNGSYEYAFNGHVRYKKCIPGETNIIDEPTVPKVYPNGNYNKTWNNEDLDDYLFGNW